MRKDFDDMTEDEILGEALGAIPEYLEHIRQSGRFDLEECVRLELERIGRLFRSRRGRPVIPNMPRPFSFGRDEAAAKAEKKALEALEAHFRGPLTERTIAVRDRYIRSRKVSQINAVAAEALITAAFTEAGIGVQVIGQRYRARVEVPLPRNARLRFYIRYKDIHKEGAVDGIVRAAADLCDKLESPGQAPAGGPAGLHHGTEINPTT